MAEELFEDETTTTMSREQAAEVLRAYADQLARHNEVRVHRGDREVIVKVPDQVTVECELEIADEGSELEIAICW